MLRKKILMVLTTTICIMTLIMPHTSVVLAAALTNDRNGVTEITLTNNDYHEGGAESTGLSSSDYDRTAYIYRMKDDQNNATKIPKFVREDDKDSAGYYQFSDAFYCLDGNASFPGYQGAITYSKTNNDFFADKGTLSISDANYNSLCWLLNNMYLRKQMSEAERRAQKNALIEAAFDSVINAGNQDDPTVDDIKAVVTDDDIEVIQQWAIWYFTNNGENTIQGVPFTNSEKTLPSIVTVEFAGQEDSLKDLGNGTGARYNWANVLYQYFVNKALDNKNNAPSSAVTYPTIANKNITATLDGSNYKVGPFKVTAPNGLSSSDYSLKLTDGSNEITNYTVKDANGNTISKKVDEIFDTDYYIYLPISGNTISTVKLELSYTDFGTKASIWEAKDRTDYQPLVLITKEGEEVSDSASANLPAPQADLALRKYIIKVNDREITDRIPNVDKTNLENGTSTTAEYKHKKEPVEVEPGDTVTYRITVYNEGEVAANGAEITDYLPENLHLIENNRERTDRVITFGTELTIEPGESVDFDITCKIADDAAAGAILTNIAEISKVDDFDDRDSKSNSIKDEIDVDNTANYTGKNNKTDLSDQDYYYKGQEDDDDFEKVKVNGKAFDLSLQKFITEVNGKKVSPSREPYVSTDPLKNGQTDAAYSTDRPEKVSAEIGDIVTYKIRVYNEGEVDGYAEQIADHIPEGLGFLPTYTKNIDNGWNNGNQTVDTATSVIKLSEITNGTANVKLADFTDETSLDDIEVMKGKIKVVTSALNSSDSSNLLKAFDGSDKLDYKDVEITCIVLSNKNLKNIAEISKNADKDGNDIKDRDSDPDSVDPDNYPEKGTLQDDDSYEELEIPKIDLSLKKFITKVNGKEVSPSREPKVDTTPLNNGSTEADYDVVKTPIVVAPGDVVTYKLRVYNEGELDAYAEEIQDFLSDGLGFLVNYKNNVNNYWKINEGSGVKDSTIKLSDIKNGTKNLKAEDFEGISDLSNVDVVRGDSWYYGAGEIPYYPKDYYNILTTTALGSDKADTLIKAYDGGSNLSYKDVEITCIVLGDAARELPWDLRNVAEIREDADKDGNEIDDRDSVPDDRRPWHYEGEENYNEAAEDDWDQEELSLEDYEFDLALQKFITGVNDKEITDRVPKVTYEGGKISYSHPQTPLEVNDGDLVTYTIRVYNEGSMNGYAREIVDDVPKGLVFDPNNEVNKKYGWFMLDSSGNKTDDSSKAVEVRTNYLSKEASEERGENALLKAFDSSTGNLEYLDVQVVFKVSVNSTDSTIVNTAEIAAHTTEDGTDSEDGKSIADIDSVPDNKKDGEDDIDKERVHVGYFDLALKKDLTKAVITEGSSTQEITAVSGQLMKVEIHRKKINSTIVKFVYNITVTNEGTIPGFATEVKDYIPEGLEFVEADNPGWSKGSDGTIVTNDLAKTLLKPGESASVQVTLKWINGENNLGMKTNVAEISADYNEANDTDDIDSTPNNKKEGEDDIDSAQVILSISTGRAPIYVVLSTGVLTMISTGVVMIKKHALI